MQGCSRRGPPALPVEEEWLPPPALADAPTVVGSGQAVLLCVVLGCVLVLGGFSIGGLASPVRSVDTFAGIDAVHIGAHEPRIHFRPADDQCGRKDVLLTCQLDIGGRSIEVRADSSARSARCAVLTDGRPVPCMVRAGFDRSAGAIVSIVDDLGFSRAEYRRLVEQHDETTPSFTRRLATVGPAAIVLGLGSAFVVFRTVPAQRVTAAARRVAAAGTGLSFAAGLFCWWIGRLVAAGHVF